MIISIDTRDIERLRLAFAQFSDRRFQSALAAGVNETAAAVRDEWAGQLQMRLDRPTVVTRKATRVDLADVGALVATVRLDSQLQSDVQPAEYLATQEFGGDRRAKKFERALQASGAMPAGQKVVPGKHAKLDGFGNISRAQIVQVLNQLGAQLSVGYQRVIGATAGKRAKSAKRAGRVYVAVPRQFGKLEPGIYQRTDDAMLPVFFFVSRMRYGKRLRLMDHAQSVARRELPSRILGAIERRLQSLLRRGS
jgi:alkylated DNA nucleotide flippase Atl1